MKRIVICMDGTWQKISQRRATNINLIARSVLINTQAPDGQLVNQIVIYTPGVGTTLDALKGTQSGVSAFNSWLTSTIGGMFGEGLEDSILETYLRLCFNYEPGDEIYIFGFSRGAFSARSLAAMIGKVGIVRRRFAVKSGDAFKLYREKDITGDSPEAVNFRMEFGKRETDGTGRHSADHRPKIRYLGIFDTVGQRGVPAVFGPFTPLFNKRYAFHNLHLGKHVLSARHALAIDEHRAAFPPTPWENVDELNAPSRAEGRSDPYQQRWFAGAHGDVGGGNTSALSAFPLAWIVEGAEAAGLVFDRTMESPLAITLSEMGPTQPITVPRLLAYANPVNWPGRWRTIAPKDTEITRESCESTLHPSATLRTVSPLDKPYAPPPLRPYRDALKELTAAVALMYALLAVVKGPPRRKKFLGIF